MIPPGLSAALHAWAYGSEPRIDQLLAERDALVTAFISGGQPSSVLTSSSFNGSSFSWDPRLSVEEKLSVLTEALELLGKVNSSASAVNLTYGTFNRIQR